MRARRGAGPGASRERRARPHASGDRFGLFFRRLLETNTGVGANVGGVITANDPSPFPFPFPSALVLAFFALDPDPERPASSRGPPRAVAGVAGSLFTPDPDGGARFAPRLLGVGVASTEPEPEPEPEPSVPGLGDASLAARLRRDASEGVRGLPTPTLRARFFSVGSSFAAFGVFAPFASPFPPRAVAVADDRTGSSTAAAAASSDGAMSAPDDTLHEMLQKSLASACSVLLQWRHAPARAEPRPLADPPFPRGCGRSERNTTRALLMT